MSFGKPSFIATRLLGTALARRVVSLRSQTQTYGSTTGPWRGIGGAAMTPFQVIEFSLGGDLRLYFADDRFLGWTEDRDVRAMFPALTVDTPGLNTSAATCPYDLPDFASARYDDAKARIASSLTMGVTVEADDPNLEAIVSAITPEQVEWIASWLAGEGIS